MGTGDPDRDTAAVAFFGDGAMAEGVLHETLNMAALWKSPLLLVCENNGWSEFSPTARQFAARLDGLAAAFGIAGGKPEDVELRFDARAAHYIRERVWHESQELIEDEGGGVRLRLRVAPGVDLRAWIKGFLPDVSVVRPASLREEIGRDLQAAMARFAPSPAALNPCAVSSSLIRSPS